MSNTAKTTGGRKSGTGLNGFVGSRSRQYAFDWNGIRRTSTWQSSRGQQPQKSSSAGVLGALFGVSAIAVLSAPVVSWVQDQADDVAIDIDGENDDAKLAQGKNALLASPPSTNELAS